MEEVVAVRQEALGGANSAETDGALRQAAGSSLKIAVVLKGTPDGRMIGLRLRLPHHRRRGRPDANRKCFAMNSL